MFLGQIPLRKSGLYAEELGYHVCDDRVAVTVGIP